MCPKRPLSPEEEKKIEDLELEDPNEEDIQETEPQEEEPEESLYMTDEQKAEWEEEKRGELAQRKETLLSKLERQIEESGKQDEQVTEELKQIAELRQKLIAQTQLNQFWQTVLSNPDWEGVLRKVFTIMVGMSKGMCDSTKITIERENDKLNFKFEWFDSKGRPVHTPLSDGVKEAMERANKNVTPTGEQQ